MAVIVANDDGPRGVTLVRPGATSEEIAKATRRITRTPEQFAVIVGYGRSAAATARETAAALGGKSLHGYVDAGDTWQAWDAPSESYRPERLPDVATQAAFITGAQRPPGAVAELRLAPEPGYAVLTTKDARALDSTAPSFRVEVARRTFDAAVAEYPKVTPARLSTLGHLATSDVAARVAIVARACHSDTAEAVVVEALRLAPVEYRPAFAEIAVTATCANGKSAPVVRGLISHVRDNSTLGVLGRSGVERGVPRDVIAETVRGVERALDGRLPQMDAMWKAAQAAAPVAQPSVGVAPPTPAPGAPRVDLAP
ncbi:hypothetical protein GCM10025876_39750 [Demequina litorisediminis]|uniref:Uncharacterized protein n=2 Tax=Demequina litorisediminis TaxID=1849022 RepID=A0ABQ6IL01_9MICO|nr:hypothetical protein GCM10025876_39750 [Demequina litorisediminis]